MIVLPLRNQEDNGNNQSETFGSGYGQPDSVQIKEDRQEIDHSDLEQERSQEGNGCREAAVVQCGEERGTIYIEAGHQERKCIEPEGVAGKGVKFRIVANKQLG